LAGADTGNIVAKTPVHIDKYPILDQVGEGGMGVIYKAQHPTLGRPVILKRLTLTGGEGAVARFKREASLMMSFRNDAIVDVYDHFRSGASWYIVMEYVDGPSLDALIREKGRLPSDVALLILFECARALKYAHDKGVVHRDIKPSNILISRKGEVKLTDFGIATVRDEEASTQLTSTGITLGTVAYMSPEQIESSRDVDKRADIYSLGVMLYEMVAGKAPFPSSFTPQTLTLIQRGKYRPVRRASPGVSPLVRRIIRRTMKPAPRRRFQDLAALLRLLERSLRFTDSRAVQGALEAYLDGKSPAAVGTRAGVPVLAAVVTVAALTGGAGALYREGTLHELLLAQSYGALQVAVQGRLVGPPVVTILNDQGEPAADAPLAFRSGAWRSRKLYLRAGTYRVGVQADGMQSWHKLLLASRERQRSAAATREGLVLTVDAGSALRGLSFPLRVESRVSDANTGADLTRATRVDVKIGDGWSPFTPEVAGRLTTGATYEFRFEHPGYFPATQRVQVPPHQLLLLLESDLLPLAGSVRVSTALSGVRLRVDGSRWYLRGGETPVRLQTLGAEPADLPLAPGRHRITAERSGAGTSTIEIDIASGERVAITIEADGTRLVLRRFP
jgi:eukaryotic-like serine/threonine-protein kinase